jgi:hypothetical protein
VKALKVLWNTAIQLVVQSCGVAAKIVNTADLLVSLVEAEVGVMADEATAERKAAAAL